MKIIGATAHYVTEELDAGPIIEQDVARVTHADDVEAMKRIGSDIERTVLARAVRWHLEDRVLRRRGRGRWCSDARAWAQRVVLTAAGEGVSARSGPRSEGSAANFVVLLSHSDRVKRQSSLWRAELRRPVLV